MRTSASILLFAALGVGGCANDLSVYRSIATYGRSVSLDAKQRVVLSAAPAASAPQRKSSAEDFERAIICAEPSPDALSSYGASVAGTLFSGSSDAQAQLAAAIAEQAASIGLRTQSIQLMRDAMYRACEGYLGGGISKEQFYLLQRRFQNLTLGLLAIEQLTGAVKAEQAVLATSSGASTGQDTQVETTALVKAEERLLAAQDELESASAKLKKDQEALAAVAAEFDEAKKKQGSPPKDATEEQKSALKAAADSAEEKKKAAQETVDQQKLVVASKKRSLSAADGAVAVAKQNLQDARGRARALASGAAALGPTADARKQITKEVAAAVESIIAKVFDESGKGEFCNGLLEDFSDKPTKYDNTLGENAVNTCLYGKQVELFERANSPRLSQGQASEPARASGPSAVPRPNQPAQPTPSQANRPSNNPAMPAPPPLKPRV